MLDENMGNMKPLFFHSSIYAGPIVNFWTNVMHLQQVFWRLGFTKEIEGRYLVPKSGRVDYLAQIATARLGIILVNINPAYKGTELEYCINKVDLKCLIFATQFKSSAYAQTILDLCPELVEQKLRTLTPKKAAKSARVSADYRNTHSRRLFLSRGR